MWLNLTLCCCLPPACYCCCCCCMYCCCKSTAGCMVSCRAHCPCSCLLPGYSFQVCIRLPYTDVGFTGLAFSSHPTYLHATLLLTLYYIIVGWRLLYTCHHTQPMDYCFRVATGRRKSPPAHGGTC
jgi:hypothetical protein